MTVVREALRRWWRNAEPNVMGRSAVANAVGWLTIAAVVQLTMPVRVSVSLALAGPDALAYTWAGTVLLAGALMVASYAVRDPETERVLELAVLALLIICSLVLVAAIEAATGVAGLVAACYSLALASACAGRGVLLVRQITAARRLARDRRRWAHDRGEGDW